MAWNMASIARRSLDLPGDLVVVTEIMGRLSINMARHHHHNKNDAQGLGEDGKACKAGLWRGRGCHFLVMGALRAPELRGLA